MQEFSRLSRFSDQVPARPAINLTTLIGERALGSGIVSALAIATSGRLYLVISRFIAGLIMVFYAFFPVGMKRLPKSL